MTDGYKVGDRVLIDDHLLGIVTEASKDGSDGLQCARVKLDGQGREYWIRHIDLRWIPPDDWKEEQDK